MSPIPILDLKFQYQAIENELWPVLKKIFETSSFILGPEVEALEKEIEAFTGASYNLGVSSGSDALLISLMALDLQPGDEVITTPFTFFATVGSILRLYCKPVFVDIQEDTFNIDAHEIPKVLSQKTKALVPVHLYGQCAEMDEIQKEAPHLPIIEDAAQAIGAKYKGRSAGSLGLMACFSFYPSKNLGGATEGGLIATKDFQLFEKMKMIRNHGSKGGYIHEFLGGNFRLSAIGAAVLRLKMKYLEDWNQLRRENAKLYQKYFQELGLLESGKIRPPFVAEGNLHTYHQYVIRCEKRDELQSYLSSKGIQTVVYYPKPLHLQPALAHLGYQEGDFPRAEKAAKEVLALPVYPGLKEEDIREVATQIRNFYQL
ncbi:MAG: DegT/DnrJ/EryC1/StrS family aminotransferase [Planctomycetota bacterium]|nr:MAG: DegT/DnrJ/EryC1/StrS family aminotransferase [Planctomycetota bacterium]